MGSGMVRFSRSFDFVSLCRSVFHEAHTVFSFENSPSPSNLSEFVPSLPIPLLLSLLTPFSPRPQPSSSQPTAPQHPSPAPASATESPSSPSSREPVSVDGRPSISALLLSRVSREVGAVRVLIVGWPTWVGRWRSMGLVSPFVLIQFDSTRLPFLRSVSLTPSLPFLPFPFSLPRIKQA